MVLVCSANGRAAQGSEACNGYNLKRHVMAALQMQATLGLLFGLAVYNNVLIEPLFPSAFYKMLILDTSEVKLPQPALAHQHLDFILCKERRACFDLCLFSLFC